MSARLTTSVVALTGAGLLCLGVVPALAVDSPEDLPAPTSRQLESSVRRWDPAGSVRQWDPSGGVRSVDTVVTDDELTTITLSTDILFASQSDDLPESAAPRILEVLDDVPEGASVQVHGHTDSLVGPIPNDELSENRAEAVADLVGTQRPDLTLEVAGFADTRPAVREDPDDPSTYATNRRVEIVHQG